MEAEANVYNHNKRSKINLNINVRRIKSPVHNDNRKADAWKL